MLLGKLSKLLNKVNPIEMSDSNSDEEIFQRL